MLRRGSKVDERMNMKSGVIWIHALKFSYVVVLSSKGEKKCEPNPCQNSGVCRELIEDEDYKCECLHGYRGKDCEGELIGCISPNSKGF